MRIDMKQGEQHTFIVEGFSTAEFITGDCIKIDEGRNTLILNLEHGSPIISVMYNMMSSPRLYDIIIVDGVTEVISFKRCAFITPTVVLCQFLIKFSEIIIFKSSVQAGK